MSDHEKFDRAMKRLLPEGWTYGYIGNVYPDGFDDRSWSIFAPHPERTATRNDQIGAFSTPNYQALLPIAQGIDFAFKFAKANPGELDKLLAARDRKVAAAWD